VAVDIVESAERAAALRRLGVVASTLHLRFSRQHGRPLALGFLGLGLLVFWVCLRELDEREATLFSFCALGGEVEHLQS
jgi:hypothetical protein